MLARPKKSKLQPSHGSEPRVMDLLEAVAMDPDTEQMYRAGRLQQQRLRAAHAAKHQPSPADAASPSDSTVSSHSMQFSSSVATQSIQSAALHPHSHTPHADISQQCPNTPFYQHEQIARSKRNSPAPSYCGSEPLSGVVTGQDAGDDEHYLRRVSMLYHELWSNDWVDINTPKDDISTTTAHEDSIPQADTPPPTPAKVRAPSHALSSQQNETVLSEAAIAAANRYSTWTLLDACADEGVDIHYTRRPLDASAVNKDLPPLPPMPPAPNAVLLEVNANPREESDAYTVQSSQQQQQQQQQHEQQQQHRHHQEQQNEQQQQDSRSSWGSLIESYMERSVTSSQTLAVDQQQTISRFSPSELADALVGTVHRLEDDSTLSQLKRWSVVKELAITESQYLRDLLLLRTVFYEPMYCGSDNSMLRVEDAQTIFGNLDQIIDCARSLVEYLTVAVVYESNRCFVARDSSICSASDQNRNRDSQMTNASTVKSRLGSSGRDSPTVIEPALPAALSGIRRECTSRPASQPEANFVRAKSNDSELQLRNSAWADISIAQAFLLTSQRMERVYGQYCRNFEAATQRLVEIKRSAAAAGLDPATPLTMPPTPVTSYRAPSTASPLSEISRGGSRSAGIFQVSSGLDYYESMDMHSGFGNPDTTYNAFIFQFMTDQKQLLEGKTTSWDLPSLLIKPVQRILKYPLLIRSLLGLTPPHTSDHSRLEKAALIVESIAETINALNGCSGLRISTATAVSNGFASGDDGQSRITRELRRVLRRKGAGNAPHTLSKFSAEIATRDKGRLSGRPKSRTKEAAEQHNSNSGAQGSGHSQSSGAEALIEQHELRLSELIRSLRQWEGDLGTMLCQQATLAGRWKELYSLSDRENGGHVSAMSVDPSMPASGLTSSCSDVPFRVGGDPRTPTTTNWQQQQQQKRSNQPEPHSPWTASQPDIRATKSHNVLRNYNRSSSGPDILEPQLPGAALNAPGSIGFSECPSSDDNDERAWLLLKESSVSRYHNALSTIFKTVYPKTICSPLHSKVYPVLNALLQVYSDGPRYILSEISRATNPNSSSLFMSPEHGDERASKLRSILAADLPKLFEYEKTVVRLTLDQIIVIERDFYSQVAAHLSPFEFGTDLPWPKHAPDNSHEHVADESPEEAATNPTEPRLRSSRSRINRPVQADSGAPGWGAQIMSSFVARFSERNRVSPSVTLPAGAECISNVQAGLWLLAQETEKNGPSQCIVKSRRRQSFTAPSDTTDSRSEFSITFDEYSETSVFAQPAVTMSIPTNGTSAFGIPASLDSPGVGISSSDVLSWQHGDAPGGQLAVAANARSVSSRHVRKKSSGFIERFAHLRPGRAARVQAALFGGGSSSSSTLPLDLGAEQVKARAHLGLAINVHKNNQMSAKNPRIRSRSTNCAETTNPLQDKSGSWSTKLDRYEPLPLVDSIRFSKGFIDSAFRAVGSENTTPAVIARVRDSSLRTKGAE